MAHPRLNDALVGWAMRTDAQSQPLGQPLQPSMLVAWNVA